MNRLSLAFAGVLALAGALLSGSSPVSAQNCSGQPAANTVCAGPTSGGAGFPSFRGLVTADMAKAPSGYARMFPHAGQTTTVSDCFTLLDPYGNPITCTNATTTQGLQEFLNATTANGWPAIVYCQGLQFPSLTEPIIINTSSSVTVPVSQDWTFRSYACNLNINVTTSSGLIFDSSGRMRFDWDGKIVYNVTSPNGDTTVNPSCAVLFHPTTNTGDGFPGIYAGNIRIGAPVVNPVTGAATGGVCFNAGTGSIIQEGIIAFDEINGTTKSFYGILQFGNTGATGFQQSMLRAGQIHGFTKSALALGTNATFASNNSGNIFDLVAINMAGAGRAVDVWGSNNQFRIGNIDNTEGGLLIGIAAESGAANNKFAYGIITGYSNSDWIDGGTCNEFTGGGGMAGGSQGSKRVLFGGDAGCTAIKTTRTVPATSSPLVLPSSLAPLAANLGALQ